MRESGFDPTDRFGPFGAGTTRLVPVSLNTLLYAMELDLAARHRARTPDRRRRLERAGRGAPCPDGCAAGTSARASTSTTTSPAARGAYPFATTFWPLWAGLASAAQARRVRDNLATFERPGGIVTSTHVSGSQWDAPFGWAPLQYLAVEGLRRAGYRGDADWLARAFLNMLADDFHRRGTLVEKYDVERRTSALDGALKYGYTSNENRVRLDERGRALVHARAGQPVAVRRDRTALGSGGDAGARNSSAGDDAGRRNRRARAGSAAAGAVCPASAVAARRAVASAHAADGAPTGCAHGLRPPPRQGPQRQFCSTTARSSARASASTARSSSAPGAPSTRSGGPPSSRSPSTTAGRRSSRRSRRRSRARSSPRSRVTRSSTNRS